MDKSQNKTKRKLSVMGAYLIIIVSVVIFVSAIAFVLGRAPASDEIPVKPIRPVSVIEKGVAAKLRVCNV